MIKTDKNILIVDDELHNIELAEIILKKEGYNLFFSINAKECFETIKKEKIDLLILDLMLPDMSGFEVLEQLKIQNIVLDVIVVSALNDEESMCKAVEFGACDYLCKPYDIISLKSKVKKVISNSYIKNLDVEKYLDTYFMDIQKKLDAERLKVAIQEFLSDEIDLDLTLVMSYLSWFSQQEDVAFTLNGFSLKINKYSLVKEKNLDVLQDKMNRILISEHLKSTTVFNAAFFQCGKYFLV